MSARILYLDDEEPLVFLMRRLLGQLGFEVAAFTRAEEALTAFTASPAGFDLVLTDMSMPGLNGLEFAQSVLAARPDALVVIATGQIREQDLERARAIGVREVIQKPNTLQEMTEIVSRLLNHSAGR